MRVAVVGAGVIGLATTAVLLEQGVDVACFERLAPMAERSAGQSRIFRLAHRDPALVELAAQARHLWTGWEGRAGLGLIDPVGAVVSGDAIGAWCEAMSAAGAVHLDVGPDSDLLRLPTRQVPARSVIDPEGGVIRVDRVRTFLTSVCEQVLRRQDVDSLDEDAGGVVLRTSTSQDRFDVIVLCAGAGTASLAAAVGLDPPAGLAHHVRFTYRVKDEHRRSRWQCWLTASTAFGSSYQHSGAPGQWSVGAFADAADVAWELGAEQAIRVSEAATTRYVREALEDVEPEVIDRLYCTVNPGLDDGVQFLRTERVLAVYGENLFKFAPLIGRRLAQSAIDGSVPGRMGSHFHT